ncbi:MAG: repeat-containing protein [Segetibacter sp.]|nr:repeat-containing protein [Segetibacter sp.]
MYKFLFVNIFLLVQFLLFKSSALSQPASVKETSESIKTYPFSDPNPIPVLGINKKVAPFYPYFTFDGYTDRSVKQDWKIVKLENPYITVSVLPEVGGKVMGAIEKATNNEFVYLNHVMKFRAIGIRGPWTSGGIEHNFGLDLGHAPWAAAAVDYVIKNNADGSVSCIVGGLDLASRSEWRVDIRLPKDKAYFETNSLWFNPSPLHHSYLSWENAAFKASDDLQFYFPGTHHIGHDGAAAPWPIDKQGRNLALYKENNFGDSKSYHVVGNYRNWFGGYWHDKKFGFGHWAPYTDAPGKKLWIWSLSREGAIWESLLTDNDGQYIEAQSGAILNQAAERSGYHSPFTQLSLRPLYAETKKEYWFPVKNTGGMADVSPFGTLNLMAVGDSVKIAVSPNVYINDSLTVTYNGQPVFSAYLQLQPMQVFEKAIARRGLDMKAVRVSLGNDKLLFAEKENEIKRPFAASSTDTAYSSAQRFFRMAEEQNSMRNYKLALNYYQQCLSVEPGHYEALSRVAEHYYRSGEYDEGIKHVRKVLEHDTYDGTANFVYGNLLLKQGKLNEAEEALSIAARTMEYRSAAYVYIAGIQLQKNNFEQAIDYSKRSLEYNKNNLLAYQFLATAYRKEKDVKHADSVLQVLLDVDPLSHYARFEQYLLNPSAASLTGFKSAVRNELPHETYLELALTYANQGLNDEAIKVLEQAPSYPTVYYWMAYLKRNTSPGESLAFLRKAEALSPAFVFPYRLETIPVLTWAKQQLPSWKVTYYLGLVHWNNLHPDKAKSLFEECGDAPDFAPFYLARGALFQGDSTKNASVAQNFERAVQLQPGEWRTWHYRSEYLFDNGLFEQGFINCSQAYKRFKENPVVSMDYAKALLNTGRLNECLNVLNKTLVLPQEGAQEGHEIYELANLSLALKMVEQKKYGQAIKYLNDAKKWPENLGSGSPYNPDNRLPDFIAAYCNKKLGNQNEAAGYYEKIADYSLDSENWMGGRNPINNYISVLVLNQKGMQQELKQLMTGWKAEQDSIRNWNITQGNAGSKFDWVFAKYNHETERAEKLQKELASPAMVNRFKLLIKALQISTAYKR